MDEKELDQQENIGEVHFTSEQYDLNNRFSYHKPFGNQSDRYEHLREKAKELAFIINDFCPKSREQSLSFTKLEECIFFANAAIARNEKEDKS